MALWTSRQIPLPAPSLDFFGEEEDEQQEIVPKKKRSKALKKRKMVHETKMREEEVALFRRQMRIKVSGEEVPPPWTCWDDLSATAAKKFPEISKKSIALLRENIERSAWTEPTAAQMQTGPVLLADRDALVSAPTGSGKTGAFLAPLAVFLLANAEAKVIVMAPSRELCRQLTREVNRIFNGITPLDDDRRKRVTVSTPRGASLSQEKQWAWAIVDEADRLLEASLSDIKYVDKVLSRARRKALFSATVPQSLEDLAQSSLISPVRVRVLGAGGTAAPDSLSQRLVFVAKESNKLQALRDLVRSGRAKPPALVFVETASRATQLASALGLDGLRAAAVSSKTTTQASVLNDFRAGRVWFLVATDLASRGLDFKALNCVVNYDAPTQSTDYLHRVGRVARAGREGVAFTLFTEADARRNMRSIANLAHLADNDVPNWLRTLKKTKKKRNNKQPDQAADKKTDEDGGDSSTQLDTRRTKKRKTGGDTTLSSSPRGPALAAAAALAYSSAPRSPRSSRGNRSERRKTQASS